MAQIPLENVKLSCFYQQGQNTGIEETSNGPQYKECWKGLYESAKGIISAVGYGSSIDDVHSALGGNRQSEYSEPSCPKKNGADGTWRLESIRVEEQTAGTNALVYIVYYADYLNFGNDWSDDPKSDVWNIEWQSYTVSPYNFLSNGLHDDQIVNDIENLPDTDWESSGMRSHLEKYMNAVAEFGKKEDGYCYRTPDQFIPSKWYYMLNGAEQAVYRKISLERNAVYHYPVVTHTTAKIAALSCLSGVNKYPDKLGGDLDIAHKSMTETSELSGCPFEIDKYNGKDYEWMKVGDSITTTKDTKTSKVRVERKTTFIGTTGFDINFYGSTQFSHTEDGIISGRWQLNSL